MSALPAELVTVPLRPVERLAALCDPGSLRLLRTAVRSERLGERAIDGDGVVAASGLVGGRPVLCYAEDPTFLGGSLGAAHAASIVELLRLAERGRRPVIGFVSSAGARLQEGLAALGGYGEIFAAMTRLSGVVPQVSIVSGTSAGGGAYAPALGDVVVMTREASMFLTGPGVVREVMGEDVDRDILGGPRVQAANGVCHFVARDELRAAELVRELLGHLPSAAGDELPIGPPAPPLRGDPGEPVPADPRRVYDVRDVIGPLVDRGRLLEYGERWARNVVCGWARIEGMPVGVVANQPRHLGGVLDAEAAQKAARFVRTCHLFGVPVVALVDTPGFLPGSGQERAAVIRHGAKLVHAFAEARVPKLTVVLRKSFGGAHIAMNSKQLGADLVLAWPGASLGVMGAEQAVGIVHRRHLAAVDDPRTARADLAAEYAAEHLTARRAAELGFVDEVVEPALTRDRLAATLAVLHRIPAGRPGGQRPPVKGAPMSDLFQRDFDELQPGERFATRGRTVTEGDVAMFAGLTGDRHPLHTDAVWAQAAGPFGERVAHGLLVVGCAAGLVPFDPERVIALRRLRDVVFKRPVRLGDTIRVEGSVAQLAPVSDEAGLVVCDWRVRNQDEALVCRMTVEVLWRRSGTQAAPEPAAAEAGLPEFVPIPL